MATDQRNLPSFFANSTDFQTWVTGLLAQLTAVGMVQTGDTGQINGATVTLPGTTNTSAGYAIYRFADPLQATLPVYLKIEFGTGAVVDRPSLWLTAGTGTNGAGTVTGNVGSRKQIAASASTSSGSVAPSYCCYDTTGGLALGTNTSSTTNSFPLYVVIDRSRDGAGTATTDGFLTWWGANNTSTSQAQIIPAPPTAVPGGTASIGTLAPNQATGTISPVGSNVLIVPLFWGIAKLFLTKMVHLARSADLGVGTAVSVNTVGGTHTYMPLVLPQSPADQNTTGQIVLLLWE